MSASSPDPQEQPPLTLSDAESLETGEASEDFEALYSRLEDVARRLEAGNLSLEQSVSLYEEGMWLAQRCQALLQQVEQRIERLQALTDGDHE